ncbi:MAG: hypothetical protein AAF902_22890 [Chloroflexota bacterium]
MTTQPSSTNTPKIHFSRILLFLLTAFLLIILTGCLGSLTSTPEPTITPILGTMTDQPLSGVGILSCNQTCADQAQCGTSADLGKVVLLSSAGPTLDAHDLIIGDNFQAQISTHMDVDVIRDGSQTPQAMRFYKVALSNASTDRGEAWVAGWCIQAPTP